MNKTVLLFVLICFCACKDSDDLNVDQISFNFPRECCTETKFDRVVLNGDTNGNPISNDVYFPTIITPFPDPEPVNHRFYLQAHPDIEEIILLEIRNLDNEVVFRQENFPPNDIAYAWDGTTNGIQIDGAYEIQAQYRNREDILLGISYILCSVACNGSNQFDFNSALCFWMSNHNGFGGFDDTLPAGFCP